MSDFQKISLFFLFNRELLTTTMPKILTEFMVESIHTLAELIQEHYKKRYQEHQHAESFCQELTKQLIFLKNRLFNFIKSFLTLPSALPSVDALKLASRIPLSPSVENQINQFLEASKCDNLIVYLTQALPDSIKTAELTSQLENALRTSIKYKIQKYLMPDDMTRLITFFKSPTYSTIIKGYEKILESAFKQMPASEQLVKAVQTVYATSKS